MQAELQLQYRGDSHEYRRFGDAITTGGPFERTGGVIRRSAEPGRKARVWLKYEQKHVPGGGTCIAPFSLIQGERRMFSKPVAVGLLALACVTAAVGGAFVAVRSTSAVVAPAATPSAPATAA